jgi:hypothetical protein
VSPATVIAVVQLLTAATFTVIPVIAVRYGRQAQQAAERQVTIQGFPSGLLAKHGIKFSESPAEALLPLGIAAILTALACLNAAGSPIGRTGTWTLQPLLLIAGGLTTAGQVFPVRFTAAALRRSGPDSAGLDARAVVDAAGAAFPAVLRPLVAVRFALVTIGSIAVLALLSR